MTRASLIIAFSGGMLAAINPCGFALLPAYLSYYLGLESGESAAGSSGPGRSPAGPLRRALTVSGAMTAGFVVVFGVIGAMWGTVQSAIGDRLPWVVVGVGIAMIPLGISMILGFTPVIRGPKLATSSGSQSAWSAFVFGVSYGVASLSCTIAPFIAVVISTFRKHSFVSGFTTLVVYAVGMGALIAALTIAVSFAQQGIVTKMRRLLPHMGRISGVLLVISGIIATYYGWYEAQILSGSGSDSRFGTTISGWRDDVAGWVQSVGEERIGIAVAIVIAGGLGIAAILRRSPPDGLAPEDPIS